MTTTNKITAIGLCAALLISTGCASRTIHTADGYDLAVGHGSGTDIPTWELLINECVSDLLMDASHRGKLVAFVGIENASGEALGLETEAATDRIDTLLVESTEFRMLNKRLIDEVMREFGLTDPSKLMLPMYREQFVELLADPARAPDFLLWARFTSQNTGGGGSNERTYILTMELVNANSGVTEAKPQARVIKEFED